ncbi:hypothetical protein, partial [Frankia sp. CiP3]|uniref:hypothetical protein n=1 Tax=Frankia sp. CiP3 TaxID=2880971 RepID=UPI001EF5A6E0
YPAAVGLHSITDSARFHMGLRSVQEIQIYNQIPLNNFSDSSSVVLQPDFRARSNLAGWGWVAELL